MKNHGPPPVLHRCPTCGLPLTSRYAVKAHAQIACAPPRPPAGGVHFTRERG